MENKRCTYSKLTRVCIVGGELCRGEKSNECYMQPPKKKRRKEVK